MILRLTERTDRVAHVPAILYHWRAHAASTAGGDAKPYAYVAARSAYAAHLERTGIAASVGYGPPGLYRVAATVDPASVITIALAVRTVDGLAAAARSWAAQPHARWRAVLTVPEAARAAVSRELTRAGIAADRVELVPSEEDPAVALATAAGGAAACGADHLLILQSPSVGLTHDWLARLAGYPSSPGSPPPDRSSSPPTDGSPTRASPFRRGLRSICCAGAGRRWTTSSATAPLCTT